ncbi:MAG: MFS transporter [Chitinophagaceae bacterium]|nr:MFS transporter [Chitinophagaceae bacterium]
MVLTILKKIPQPLRLRIAVGSFFFFFGMTFASWASRIPDIQTYFLLSDATLGNMLLIIPIGSLLALLSTGYLIQRFGSKRVLVSAMVCYMCLLLCIGVVKSIYILCGVLLIFGFCGNVLNISMNTQALLVQKIYGKIIIASFHGLWSLSGFVGAFIGLFMTSYSIVPAYHFFLMLCFVLSGVLLVHSFLSSDKPANSIEKKKIVFYKPDSALVKIGVIAFCGLVCEGCMFDWSGVYFRDVVKVDKELILVGYSAFLFTMAMGRFISDTITNMMGTRRMLIISGILMCSGLLLAVLFPSLVFATLGFTLVGLGSSSVVPVAYTIAGNSQKIPPSFALSLVSSIGFSGFLFGPPLIGYISHYSNLRYSFAVVAMIGGFIVLLTFFMKEKK